MLVLMYSDVLLNGQVMNLLGYQCLIYSDIESIIADYEYLIIGGCTKVTFRIIQLFKNLGYI